MKCGTEKPLEKFPKKYKKGEWKGYRRWTCSACVSRKSYAYRQTDEYKAKQRARAKLYYQKNKHWLVKNRSPEGEAAHREAAKEYKQRNPIKQHAKGCVSRALASGQIVKSTKCESCGKESKIIDGHHDDYSKPLDVRWLCRQCHKDWHAKNGPGLNGDDALIYNYLAPPD